MSRTLRYRLAVLLGMVLVIGLLAGCGEGTTDRAVSDTGSPKPFESFTRENWALLVSNPDAYEGASVDIVGQVFMDVERDEDWTYWQMYADPEDYDWNTIVGFPDPNFQLSEDDYVHVTGVVMGEYEGENILGAKITAVQVMAYTAEVVDASATASPAKRTVTEVQSLDQHGLTITVDKVEFAFDETRVFLSVNNGSSSEASFYSFDAKMTQGSSQYEAEYFSDYPEVQSDLLPGIISSGVIVFPVVDSSQAVTLYLEARTDDYSLDFDPYVFQIPGE